MHIQTKAALLFPFYHQIAGLVSAINQNETFPNCQVLHLGEMAFISRANQRRKCIRPRSDLQGLENQA